MFKFSGKRPGNLGARDGKLAPCPSKPNCVCSQQENDAHHVAPIAVSGSREQVMKRLEETLKAQPNARVITRSDGYLHAEFETPLMGFVDDVEFYLPADGQQLHVRSASRLGYSDMGVNRKRVEMLRKALAA